MAPVVKKRFPHPPVCPVQVCTADVAKGIKVDNQSVQKWLVDVGCKMPYRTLGLTLNCPKAISFDKLDTNRLHVAPMVLRT